MDFDTDNIKDYLTDPEMEKVGVWLKVREGLRFHCKRPGGANQQFEDYWDHLRKPYRFQIQQGTMDPKIQLQIMIQAYCTKVIDNWDGVTSGGEPVEYTPEAAMAYFAMARELFLDLTQLLNERRLFVRAEIDGAVDSLGNLSDGTGPTTLSPVSSTA